MSKKEKRRAARQAFPKAKVAPAASRGRYASGARGRTSAGAARSRAVAAGRSRGQGGGLTLRPPTIKKAAITGAILAFLYFALIQWGWKSGGTTELNALLSVGVFFLYSGVVYGVGTWIYRRKMRRLKDPSK
jgi:hypothetical protein